jgi:hypothetical protein
VSHLRPLENEGIISWYDRQVLPGTQWDDEIRARLNSADIILLLISADFLATDYCTKVEIPEALRRHRAGGATVMPVILRHCGWDYTPLAKIQAYPEKAKPIKSWADIDAAYLDVVRGVYLAASAIKQRRQTAREQLQPEQQRQALERRFQELNRMFSDELHIRQRVEAVERQRQQELEQQRQELASEKGIDYTKLRDLLQANQWKEADRETYLRMLEAVGRKDGDWVRAEDLQNFPCADLQTIDRLWVKYSNGHFGFSVQKKIWQECGNPTSNGKDWDRFCVKVGWQNSKATAYVPYSDLEFSSKKSPAGELPFWVHDACGGVVLMGGGFSLLSRRDL